MTRMFIDFNNKPRFYFTAHPCDAVRARLLKDCYIMMVAAAHWDPDRQRFKIARPPSDHIAGWCLDSGGFTAARRWGKYPWTYQQYVDFAREMSRDTPLCFLASLDYACERSVNRSTYATNIDRIKATIENEIALRELAPDLPWLPVLQGDTFEERLVDIDLRRSIGLLPKDYAGIGSVCGRGVAGAVSTVQFYADQLPGVKYHGFGMHVMALDDFTVFTSLRSWDSYSWSWGRGKRNVRAQYQRRINESWSTYTRRLAFQYWTRTIQPRLRRNSQITFQEFLANAQITSPLLIAGD